MTEGKKERIVVADVNALYQQCVGHTIKIYGAKTVAQRACYYLETKGVEVASFLVSNKFANPDKIHQKIVERIEEIDNIFDCIVVAVSEKYVWEIAKQVENYNVNKIVVVSPLMVDDFPTSCLLSEKSRISFNTILADKVQIVCDETSIVTIEDDVFIQEGTVVLVSNNSCVHIESGTIIGRKSFISVDENSMVWISQKVGVGKKTHVKCGESSKIFLKEKVEIGENTTIGVQKNSQVQIENGGCIGNNSVVASIDNSLLHLDEVVRIGKGAIIGCSKRGKIVIGKQTTSNDFLYMGAESSLIQIGEDNMFSYYVKINVGSHKIIDQISGKEITNYTSIKTGKHVWIGMGGTLLPGCEIGMGSVIGANAVVNGYIPNNVTCAGNIAKVLRENIEWEREG